MFGSVADDAGKFSATGAGAAVKTRRRSDAFGGDRLRASRS